MKSLPSVCENSFAEGGLAAEDSVLTEGILMSLPAAVMPEKETTHCTYTQVKVDDELTARIRAAVAKLSLSSEESGKSRVSVQEYVSDLLNVDTARILGVKPIKRRPPPNPPKGKGRPKKDK